LNNTAIRNNHTSPNSSHILGPSHNYKAIIDTGSTAHYFGLRALLRNKQLALLPMEVELPDQRLIRSTHTGMLPIQGLPPEAITAHLFKELGDTCLISMGQLCDYGCEAHFTETTVEITFQGKVILRGTRDDESRGLWMLTLPAENVALTVKSHATTEQQVAFAHAALFSPAISTLKKALDRGYLPPFPGLTSKSLKKYPPHSMATAKGHLDAIRKNQKSTKPAQAESRKQQDEAQQAKMEEILQELQDDYFPPQPENGKRTNACFIAIYEARGSVSSDLTGRFPIPSSSGNHYIMCVYDYDANYIFQRATKNRTSKMLLECWDGVYKELVPGGCRPILHRLANAQKRSRSS
jgi:hypothetical protein